LTTTEVALARAGADADVRHTDLLVAGIRDFVATLR
jgi:hypothetical protein